jgi:hypothetical protein
MQALSQLSYGPLTCRLSMVFQIMLSTRLWAARAKP